MYLDEQNSTSSCLEYTIVVVITIMFALIVAATRHVRVIIWYH